MRVLAVNISDTSGGAARAAYRIHQAVQGLGVDSCMLVKDKQSTDKTVFDISDFDNTNIVKEGFRFVQHKIKNKVQQYRWGQYPNREEVFLSDLRSTSIHGAFQKIDFDVLHMHWINLRYLDLKELTKIQKPIVWTLHDSWAFTAICHYFYDCERYKTSCGNCPFLHSGKEKDLSYEVWHKKQEYYKELDLHIVTPSQWLSKAASSSGLLSQFPVHTIPNPIDINLFTSGNQMKAREELQLQQDKKYILFGAMNATKDRRKGFDYLVKAIQHIEQKYNYSDIELLVFGSDGVSTPIDTEISIKYLGYIHSDTNMAKIYQSADVMVVPSLSENLSNAIMESLSCGTPVVGFDIGGNSDLIEHQQNGYLAQALSVVDLADGIMWCLKNNETDELGHNARKKVVENYRTERVGGMYKAIYETVIK